MARGISVQALQEMQRGEEAAAEATAQAVIDPADVPEEQAIGEASAAPERTASRLVPADSSFAGRGFREAPELGNIASTLMERHGFLKSLVNCDLQFFWKRKTGVSKGKVKIGFLKRASDLLGHYSGVEFIVWLSASTARDASFDDRQIEAAVFHQLLHIGEDDKGNWIKVGHDFEGFGSEVREFGPWTEDLKVGRNAFRVATQLGLLEQDEDDDEDDEDDDEDEEEGEPVDQAGLPY